MFAQTKIILQNNKTEVTVVFRERSLLCGGSRIYSVIKLIGRRNSYFEDASQ